MPVQDPEAAVRMIEQATQRLGLRALISAGWSELTQSGGSYESNERVRVVGALNHDAVMPRCRLAVHHGGSGTTAASVASGLPTLVCSVFADQPFWGRQLARLGAGAHLRFDSLTAVKLERALRRMLRPEATQRARALASAMSHQPNAAARAAELIEARLAGRYWFLTRRNLVRPPRLVSGKSRISMRTGSSRASPNSCVGLDLFALDVLTRDPHLVRAPRVCLIARLGPCRRPANLLRAATLDGGGGLTFCRKTQAWWPVKCGALLKSWLP